MLILGMDTSGRQATLALIREDGGELKTLELATLADGRASEVLVPGIASLLERHGVSKSSLSLLAVASGPGSFTGLRVAVASAKGLAEALAIPVVAVSILEALALATTIEGQVIAVLDAQRDEVFFGDYTLQSGSSQRIREGIIPCDQFIARFAGESAQNKTVITSEDSLAERLRNAGIQAVLAERPTAEQIAQIAYRKFVAGERSDVAALDANYLRRSDAEIVFSRKADAESPRP